ncbi:uncharacterized protein [Antedon mediterranea]|uniref:uncharacterized protein isoform X1 n=1 Tax=Antedon mediterranea TaxID=105859 RepID=UPI003AF85FD1
MLLLRSRAVRSALLHYKCYCFFNIASTTKRIRNKKKKTENKNDKQPEKLETKQKNQIMISYSHKQRRTVGLIFNSLKKRLEDTHTIWIDKRKMFGQCDKVLEYDKKLIPLKMESYKPKKDSQIQQVIAGRFYIDFSKTIRYEENINTLIRNIEELEKYQM